MSSGINNKINEFLCTPKNVKKRRNKRLEKCYGHVNTATAINKTSFHLARKAQKLNVIEARSCKAALFCHSMNRTSLFTSAATPTCNTTLESSLLSDYQL